MINKLTYCKVNEYLTKIKNNNYKENEISNIYIEYLKRNEYIEGINKNGTSDYTITNKGNIFLLDYKNIFKKIEYFFKDYEFLGSVIIGFFGGLGATILNIILK